ncbi:MAG: hypothetical protein RL026_520 [Pseudomonadota bacterium]|jgi:NCS2 family nucleobase:cation symporter-2
MTTPANLQFGLEDRPSPGSLLLLGLQHVVVNTSGWLVLVAVMTAIGSDVRTVESLLRMGMVAVAFGTVLQVQRRFPSLGSGYLCPPVAGPAYASVTVLAGQGAGLPAVFGMTALAGLAETAVARWLPRLRSAFPPEVVGTVMTMVGFSMLPFALPRLLGTTPGSAVNGTEFAIGAVTLVVMLGCSVWGRGAVRLYQILIAIGAGLLATKWWGQDLQPLQRVIADRAWFGLPERVPGGMAFEPDLLVPFFLAMLASSLKGIGDLTLCQRINDSRWTRADLPSVSGGLTASGLTTFFAGALGAMGHSTSSSNVGLSLATGATSRVIGYSMGALLLAIACMPKVAAAFAGLPQPIMGSILMYAACFMIVAGLQMITSRLLDARRTLVVGISLSAGLAVYLVPDLAEAAPRFLMPALTSSVASCALVAVVLHLVTRIGIAQTDSAAYDSSQDNYAACREQVARFGARVAAAREGVAAAQDALATALDALRMLPRKEAVQVRLWSDTYALGVDIDYSGPVLPLPTAAPGAEQVLESDASALELAGYLLRRKAGAISQTEGDGRHGLRMRWD